MDRREATAGLIAAMFNTPTTQVVPAAEFTTELISYPSRGRTIRAAVFRPTAEARGSGVAFMHGSGSIGPRQLRFAQRFAEDGYISIVPTYLDAAADDNVRPERVMSAWRDCGSDAVDWLIAQGIDRRRTGLMGYSLGSYIAVDGALGNSRAAAAIAIAGGWEVYPPRSPARRIPVLIIRAERDTHVRPQGTEQWRQFLTDRDVPVRVHVVRGAGHIMDRRQWDEVFARASAFLGGNIGRRGEHPSDRTAWDVHEEKAKHNVRMRKSQLNLL